ncbi:MAG: mechanosensitive ion channel, partial [Trueperaceae bacterium]
MHARLIVRTARVLACAALLGSPWAGAAEPTGAPPGIAGIERVSDLGPWTGGDDLPAKLRTPRSALETFLEAGKEGRFTEAAGVLNLSDLQMYDRIDRGPDLAEKLYFVLERRLDVNWREVPDRPDGAADMSAAFLEEGAWTAPEPRHNLRIGEISGGTAPVEIRLERVQASDMPPVWLIGRSTVRSIDVVYERHGPGWFDRNAPAWAWATFGAAPVWQWLGFILLVLLSVAIGLGLQRLVLRWLATSKRRRIRGLVGDVARPLAVLASVSVLWLTSSTLLSLSGPSGRWVATTLAALFVVAITWLAVNTVNSLSEFVFRQRLAGSADPAGKRARLHLTNLSVARRTIVFAVLLVGVAVALAQFDAFRTVGASLLASAGVAGIILGVAAQGSLSNVIAGIQIALTQLIRIGDAVYFEGNWGTIEDITYTYVIVRTWDLRRIAVPNRYLIAHPLENWEMTQPNMILPVILHVDYRAPVEVLRNRYAEVLEASEGWDRVQAPRLQVIDATEDTMKVRVLCSAKNASTAWDLHCHVREELVAFLRDWDDGRYLPRSRVRVEGEGAL